MNRTTEREVGFLSKLVSKLWIRKAEAILELLEDGGDANVVIEDRTMQAMGKWVLDNGILAAPDADSEDSPLHSQLRAIREKSKNKVIDFKKEKADGGL